MDTVLHSIKNHIGILTLNRSDKNNTFNSQLASELNQKLKDFETNKNIRVVIINAKGRNFSTGIDLNEFYDKSYHEYLEWTELMERMSVTIEEMKKPVIVAVQGYAVANGIGLVASADFAIATQTAKFGATAINVGLFCIGPAVPLARVVGRRKALELVLTGDIIGAGEAKEIGLVNYIVEEKELESKAIELAEKLANKSPIALQIGKQAFNATADLPYLKALEVSHSYFAHLCSTEDAQEGVDAFLNKREPKWNLK